MAAAGLHVPRSHGEKLAVPPLSEVGALVQSNRGRLASWSKRREPAVREITEAARRYLAEWNITPPTSAGPGLLIAGHQPELFHPGVWLKNFALSALAKRHGLTPLNLTVDNDLAKPALIRVPATLPHYGARRVVVPFDRMRGPLPYEEWHVNDEALFADFPNTVLAELKGRWQPILPAFWDDVTRLGKRTRLAGERVALARRLWEERWDCRNLELPISRLADTSAFHGFAAFLLLEAPRFLAVHNRELAAYRRRHGIRSRHHPVPELTRQDEWHETPLWVWRSGDSQRGRLFARQIAGAIELRAGETHLGRTVLQVDGLTAFLRRLRNEGYKIRPRALTTTLFARLYLADLFIHGIGGGIYDELTDELIRGFFGLEPPAFLVLSGTLLLPQPSGLTGPAPAELGQQLRRIWYNPERLLSDSESEFNGIREWIERKAQLVAQAPVDAVAKRHRFHSILAANERLRRYAESQLRTAQEHWQEARKRRDALEVWKNREYAFCLYPEDELRSWLTTL
jgi:hypothetical protein